MPLYRVRVWRTVGLLAVCDVEAPDRETAESAALEEEQHLAFDEYTIANLEEADLGLVEEIRPVTAPQEAAQ